MTDYLADNQVVLAVSGAATKRILEPLLQQIRGRVPVFDIGAIGVRFSLQVPYSVRDVNLALKHPYIAIYSLGVDITLDFGVTMNLNQFYDSLPLPLPPRQIHICIPWTDICYDQTIIDLPTIKFDVPIPLSFQLAGLYQTAEIEEPNQFYVCPSLVSVTAFVIDPVRTVQRLCDAIAGELPWPLSDFASDICNLFGQIFQVVEDALAHLSVDLDRLIFDPTNGDFGLQLKFVRIFALDKHRMPGTGNNASNPAIPVELRGFGAKINSSDELEAWVQIFPA